MFWTTELVSYSGREVISSFHSNFSLLSLLCVWWKLMNDTNVHVGHVDCHFRYKKLLHSICDHFFLSFFINWLSEVALNLSTTQLPFVFPVVCTACRFLTLTKANFVWKHMSKLLFKLVVENKQHKQLIDRTKPDDVHLHVPFQQFLFITILIYTAAF